MGETINKIKNQLNEFWQSLDKGQKIRIAATGILSMLVVSAMVFFLATPQYEVLYSNLEPKDAGEVRDKIKEAGVPVKVDGTTILVPKDKIDEIRITLAMEGLPRNEFTFPEMLKSSFNETSEDKKQKQRLYLENVLANGIKALQGVEWAQVNLTISEDSPFIVANDVRESSAGIIVKMKPGAAALDEAQVNGIVQFICKSVPGLKAENVSIIDDMGRALKAEDNDINPKIIKQMDMQEAVKNNIQKSIQKFLESVFGPNNVAVQVAVKLNFDSDSAIIKEYTPVNAEQNSGIVRNMEEIKKEWVDDGTGGVPGTDTNSEIGEYATVDSNNAKYTEASTKVSYEINETQRQIVSEQGNIESISLSVLINKNGLKEDMLNNLDELKTNIRDLVKYSTQGLNIQQAALDNNIYVQVMDFDTSVKDKIAKAQLDEEKAQRNERLLTIGAAVAAMLVLGASMFMLLRRRNKAEDLEKAQFSQFSVSKEQMPPVEEIDVDEKNEIKKKIDKFVGQRPEQVAQLLKTWLNEE